jgi:protoporphyrinogen oxidase
MAAERWLIVGGGMLGLVLAWRLARAGKAVAVFEAAPGFGGLASPWRLQSPHSNGGSVVWDRYYHVIAGGDSALRGLLDELGLAGRVRWRRTHTNLFDGRRLQPLNQAWDYVRLRGVGPLDKARLALTVLRAARLRSAHELRALESLSAEDWLVAQGGAGNWRALWRPLLRSKLGANAEHATAAYIVAVIQRFYGAREGASRHERFGHVDGGYATVVEALLQALRGAGVELHAGWPVQAVARDGSGFVLNALGAAGVGAAAGDSGARSARGSHVVMTCATPLAAAMCPELPAPERAALAAQRWQGVVCVSLLLTRPLGRAYLSYLTDESLPFTTVIEMTDLVDARHFGGLHLVYLPRYVPADDPLFDRSDADIEAEFTAGLMRMFDDLRPDQIAGRGVARSRHVLALATHGYSSRVPQTNTSVAGLHVVSSAQIVNAALSVDQTVRLADAAVAQLLAA